MMGDKIWIPGMHMQPEGARILQYHASHTDRMKKVVAKNLSIKGPLKLVFATVAYGMGTDSPYISRIVHAGPPRTLEEYIQEVGRAGRDGGNAEAILYHNNSDIGNNIRGMTKGMREFCKNKSICRRKQLNEYFDFDKVDFDMPATDCRCCDICANTCVCDGWLLLTDKTDVKTEIFENVNDTDLESDIESKDCIFASLNSYFDAENETLGAVSVTSEIITGLSHSLAQRIMQDFRPINCPRDLITNYKSQVC